VWRSFEPLGLCREPRRCRFAHETVDNTAGSTVGDNPWCNLKELTLVVGFSMVLSGAILGSRRKERRGGNVECIVSERNGWCTQES